MKSAMLEAIEDKRQRQAIVESGEPTLAERFARLEAIIMRLESMLRPTYGRPDDGVEQKLVRIRKAVCDGFKLTISQLTSACHNEKLSTARFIGYWLCNELTDASMGRIAAVFGRDCNGTARHGIRQICNRMDLDKVLKTNLEKMREDLRRALAEEEA